MYECQESLNSDKANNREIITMNNNEKTNRICASFLQVNELRKRENNTEICC